MSRNSKRRLLLLGGSVAVGIAVALLIGRAWPGRAPAMDDAALEQRALHAAMERIGAESRAFSVPPRQSAPVAPTAEALGQAAVEAEGIAPPAPAPPDGFSFVDAPLPMARAPLPPHESLPAQEPKGMDWLGTAESLALVRRQADRAQRDWSFGWLRLAEDAPAGTVAATLRRHGGDVLGMAGNLARVRLPADDEQLRSIASLPFVAALGAMPTLRKLASMPDDTLAAPAGAQTPVLVTLMTDDADGRWRRALEDMGAAVGRFRPDIRVYAANAGPAALRAIAAADFVAAVHPVRVVRAAHDLAVPAMGADGLRDYRGSPGAFFGAAGASVPVGIMDTGLNLNHLDISSNRRSICGRNVQNLGAVPTEDDADLWLDSNGHGTHVAGTLLGNGHVDPQFAGVAPGVRHIRFAKVLNFDGGGSSLGIMSGMDYLAAPSSCAGAAARMPLIVNMSLSADGRLFQGVDAEERKIDGIVWAHHQLYVAVQGNADVHGFSSYGAAKNTLAVGAVRNDGELALFSSRGPTADGRLAPQVVASGVLVRSAKGDGSEDGYLITSGTSMATPAVAGVAALLMDASAAHKRQPALVRARLMASAIKPDAWLAAPARFPAHNSDGPGELQGQYGLGKVSAHTSVLNRDAADGWLSGSGVSEPRGGEYAWQDIVVPAGASRLDLVLTWDEPPAEPVGRVVLNDLDLWLDAGADCGSGACGEHSSRSRKDNVEWIIVRNPAPGTYRAKVAAHRVYGAAPRAALAWTVIRGPSTPTLEVRADKTVLRGGGEEHDLRVSVTTDGYVAAGARLVVSCRAADGTSACEGVALSNLRASREDDVSVTEPNATRWEGAADLEPVEPSVAFIDEVAVPLGEVVVGETQTVDLAVSYSQGAPADAVRLYFTASAWNAAGASLAVDLVRSGASAAGNPVRPPDNDDFASAARLAGSVGSRPFDLLRSTTEPGEVLFQDAGTSPFSGVRPYDVVHSLWYLWRAPAAGLYRFGTRGLPSGHALDVFGGDRLADLERLAHGDSGAAAFFAEAGQRLRIRISTPPLNAQGTLHWSQGRPENDDFDNATGISGAQGSSDGDNAGAGMELGEWFGSAAATVWYRWTAPRNGDFAFSTTTLDNTVMVFDGDAVSDLRLVSGHPSVEAYIGARQGGVYRVAVAARDAHRDAGDPFTLTWQPVEDVEAGLNFFATAEEMPGESSAVHDVRIHTVANVEPGEPASTGVRTNWWAWTAPASGRFTWRLTQTDGLLFRIAAWSGDAVADARLAAISDEYDVTPEFVLDAAAGQRYRISLGFLADDVSAFDQTPTADALLEWGPTPPNDGLAAAIAIGGASGAASGNNGYATIHPREATRRLGHSSLWWDFQAPSSGAYRFQADGSARVLAVYQRNGDGHAGLAFLASGHGEVAFDAAAGARYAIRVGSGGAETGGFTLRWHAQNVADGMESHTVPFFPAAANEAERESPAHELIEGLVRLSNRSERRGDVRIHAFDDAGDAAQDTVTVRLEARQKVHFDSGDLERGNANKPLAGTLGEGRGDWRLHLTSELDVDVSVYARTLPGGFLTALHDRAPCVANRCEVAIFNPASNEDQRSLLRLVNAGDTAAAVTIDGVDDNGASPGDTVRLQLPAGTARTLTAVELETGNGAGLTGALGDGAGKWELAVAADREIHVLSLLRSSTGHLTNLSTIVR